MQEDHIWPFKGRGGCRSTTVCTAAGTKELIDPQNPGRLWKHGEGGGGGLKIAKDSDQ